MTANLLNDTRLMGVAWICLVVVSVGDLGFGMVTLLPAVSDHDLDHRTACRRAGRDVVLR